MKAKKLLAVLLTLTMLVGLVPVAGLLTSAAETPAKMTEIAIAKGNAATVGEDINGWRGFKALAAGDYTVSFDYYLSGEGATYGMTDKNSQIANSQQADAMGTLSVGKNTFTKDFTLGGTVNVMLAIMAIEPKDGVKLYVWNTKLVKKGETTNLLTDETWRERDYSTGSSKQGEDQAKIDYDEALLGGAKAKMTEIAIAKGNAATVGEDINGWRGFKALAAGDYTVSFDYYLSGEGATYGMTDKNSQIANSQQADAMGTLSVGKNTFTKDFTLGGTVNVMLAIMAIEPKDGVKLYVWNTKLVKKGETTNLLTDETWRERDYSTGSSKQGEDQVKVDYDESLFVGVGGGEGEGSGEGSGESTVPTIMTKLDLVTEERAIVGTGITTSQKYKTVPVKGGVAYTFSFDYYLKAAEDSVYGVTDYNGYLGNHADPKALGTLENGTHSFEVIKTCAGNADAVACLGIKAVNAAEGDVLYVWNVRLVAAGSTENIMSGATWKEITADGNPGDEVADIPYDESVVGKVEEGEKENEDGNVIRFNFDKYDWADNDYTNPRVAGNLQTGIKPAEGDKVTIEFEYCIPWDARVIMFSPYSNWADHADNPGFVFSDNPDEQTWYNLWGSKKDKIKFEFTADKDDASRNILLYIQSSYDYEGEVTPVYLWNIKITVNDTVKELDYKTLKANGSGFDWAEVLDIDPATIELAKPEEGDADDGDDDNDDDSADADDGEDVGGDGNADDEGDSPDTGDTVTGVVMAAVVLALAAATLMISKKRKA